MSSENKVSKFLKYSVNEEEFDDNQEYEDEIILKQEQDEIDEYNNMIYNTKMSLLQFVNEKSIPLCEYLTENHIEKFILNNFK